MPTYDRPVTAKLVVVLENGETWDADTDDFEVFNLVNRLAAYRDLEQVLTKLGMDGDRRHSALRYVIERHLAYSGTDLDIDIDDPDSEDAPVVAEVRRFFEQAGD